MEVERLIVGQLQTNCYLVYSASRQAIIIDPGDDADLIIARIQSLEIQPQYILATHGHFDHVLAATELRLAYGIPFLLHQADALLLRRADKTSEFFTGIKADPAFSPDAYLTDGQVLTVLGLQIRVIATPGHTPGSVCFFLSRHRRLFTGDTLFKGAVGRTDLAYSDPLKLQDSLVGLTRLPSSTRVYPGHGLFTQLSQETWQLV